MEEYCEEIGEGHGIVECPVCSCKFCHFCDEYERQEYSLPQRTKPALMREKE